LYRESFGSMPSLCILACDLDKTDMKHLAPRNPGGEALYAWVSDVDKSCLSVGLCHTKTAKQKASNRCREYMASSRLATHLSGY